MYLNEVSLFNVVKKQIHFKVKSYTGIFHSLVLLQVLGLFLSTLGVSSMSESGSNFSLTVEYFTSGIVLWMTAIWLFINTILLTTKAYREDDFTFISTRLSRLWANIVYLGLLTVMGAISAYLATNVLKLYLILKNELIILDSLSLFSNIFSLLGLIGYFILVSAIAYTIGSIIQRSKLIAIVTSISLMMLGIIIIRLQGEDLFAHILNFFIREPNLALFWIKISITSSLLFLLSWIMSKNQEVQA